MFSILSFTLSILCFALSILNPAYYPPWSSFISEYFAFLSLLFLLPLFFKRSIYIPKISIFFIAISLIPVLQYYFGQLAYFDRAALSVIYICSFWVAIVIGFNSVERYKSSLNYFFLVILSCGIVSSLIAITQWLNIEISLDWALPVQSRPVANMGQSNHLATFLLLGCISCLYYYECKSLNNLFLIMVSLLFIFVIAITQSRTAWVSALVLYLYWISAYKRDLLNFNIRKQTIFLVTFISSVILLPFVKAFVTKTATLDVVERTTSAAGFQRIEIWQQAIESIRQQPLWGYGWNQSSFAQYETIKPGYAKHFFTSFHNALFDIIIWCGIPIGITVILVCTFIVIKLLRKSFNATQICLISAVCVILTHALLESPLSYSYFLLPLGFMLGSLFYSFEKKLININGLWIVVIFLVGVILSLYLPREYSYIPDNMVAAETHEMNERKGEVDLPYPDNFFNSFDSRARWISLYPCTEQTIEQIKRSRDMVKTYMIHYDLYKFAQVLYFNNYRDEAQKQLDILNYMYEKQYVLSSLKCVSY